MPDSKHIPLVSKPGDIIKPSRENASTRQGNDVLKALNELGKRGINPRFLTIPVSITDIEAGAGQYEIQLIAYSSNAIDPAADLTEAMIGQEVLKALGIFPGDIGGDHQFSVGDIVMARFAPMPSTDGRLVLIIEGGGASESIGQYQGQVEMNVSNNASGREFPQLVPVL